MGFLGLLKVSIMEAKKLKSGSSSASVEVSLRDKGCSLSTESADGSSRHPRWNEDFLFLVSSKNSDMLRFRIVDSLLSQKISSYKDVSFKNVKPGEKKVMTLQMEPDGELHIALRWKPGVDSLDSLGSGDNDPLLRAKIDRDRAR